MRIIKSYQIFEASNLMWHKHISTLKKAFICSLLKLGVQIVHYTLLYFHSEYACKLNPKLNTEKLRILS